MTRSRLYGISMPACRRAFTMAEMIVVIAVLCLSTFVVILNTFDWFGRNTFKSKVQEFISVMQLAADTAAQSEKRYEIIIDITEQSYLLREVTVPDLDYFSEEQIIRQGYFNENCRVDYCIFDDLVSTNEDQQIAKFRVGHAGWQNGAKIVLFDRHDQPWSVLISRLTGIVSLEKGDVELLLPKEENEMSF